MSAEDGVVRTINSYVMAHDRRDENAIAALFAEDAVMRHRHMDRGGGLVNGREGVRAYFTASRENAVAGRQTRLMCGNVIVTDHGDTAESLADVVSITRDGDAPWRVNQVLQWADTFVRHGTEWLYATKQTLDESSRLVGTTDPGQSAEAAVRRTLNRYVMAHDRHEVDEIVKLFDEDASFSGSAGLVKGLAAIRKFYENARDRMAPGAAVKLLATNAIISVDADHATAQVDVVQIRQSEPAVDWQIARLSRWDDTFVCRNGNWLYAEKRTSTI